MPPLAAKRLGIIGGVGPDATARLYTAIHRTNGGVRRPFPEVVLYNLPLYPETESAFIQRSIQLDDRERDRVEGLLEQAVSVLVAAEVDAIAIPCNTLQPMVDAVCRTRGVTHLNLLDAVTTDVQTRGAQSALILGTATTCALGVYEPGFERTGIRIEYPRSSVQHRIGAFIRARLNGEADTGNEADVIREAVQTAPPVDAVVVACTDLQAPPHVNGRPTIDSFTVLAHRVHQWLDCRLSSEPLPLPVTASDRPERSTLIQAASNR